MTGTDIDLLRNLCNIFAPSGNESAIKTFLIQYTAQNKGHWAVQPELVYGQEFQDYLILKFVKPRTAIFAHMDSIGFFVRYQNQLIPIGGSEAETGYKLVGVDAMGQIECTLKEEDGHIYYNLGRDINLESI